MSKKHKCRVCGKRWRCNGFDTCEFRLEAIKVNKKLHKGEDIQDTCTCSKCHVPMDWECSDEDLTKIKVEFT